MLVSLVSGVVLRTLFLFSTVEIGVVDLSQLVINVCCCFFSVTL